MKFLKKYFAGDPYIWLIYIALCAISAIVMFSASSALAYKANSYMDPVISHMGFLAAGIGVVMLGQIIPRNIVRYGGIVLCWISIVLLIAVLFIGVSDNNINARWIKIFGFQFQPSEFGKLSLILTLAHYMSIIHDSQSESKNYKIAFGYIICICGLIVFTNLSTAILLFTVSLTMMFVSGLPFLKRILLPIVVIAAIGVCGYFIVKVTPYESMPSILRRSYTWVGRIDRFLDKENEEDKYTVTDENIQEIYSQLAIAKGGLIGVGPGNSVERDFLPLAYADYIYAIIVEEFGSIGGILIIMLYLFLLFRAGFLANRMKNSYDSIAIMGLASMITYQALLNICVATNTGPVTGQPLPLISHGGTSILLTSCYFAIIMCLQRHNKIEEEKAATADAAQSVNIESASDEEEMPIEEIEETIEENKE